MVKLIFVRHGESNANANKVFAGHLDFDLSKKGRHQAEMTAQYIMQNYSVDKIYSSDLKRAYCTALTLADKIGKKVVRLQALREIDAGKWQGVSFTEIETLCSKGWKIWQENIGKAKCPNGETVKQLAQRIWKCILKLVNKNEGKTIVVVTHATPLRAVFCKLQNWNLDEMKTVPWFSNASITIANFDNGSFFIEETNNDNHLFLLKTNSLANV